MTQHAARITDVEALTCGTRDCALWHEGPDGYCTEADATAQITLNTTTGLRVVDVCDEHLHASPAALVPWSDAVSETQAELEGAVREACWSALVVQD